MPRAVREDEPDAGVEIDHPERHAAGGQRDRPDEDMTQRDEGIVRQHDAALRVPADDGEGVLAGDEGGAGEGGAADPDEAVTGAGGRASCGWIRAIPRAKP